MSQDCEKQLQSQQGSNNIFEAGYEFHSFNKIESPFKGTFPLDNFSWLSIVFLWLK